MSSEPFQMGPCQQEAPRSGWKRQMDSSHPNTRLPGSQLSRGSRASTGENLCASAEYRMRKSMKNGQCLYPRGMEGESRFLFILPTWLPQNGHQPFTERGDFYRSARNAITKSLSLLSSQWDETDLSPIHNRYIFSQRIANGQLHTELLSFSGWVPGTCWK